MTTYVQNVPFRHFRYVEYAGFSIILMLIYKDPMEGLSSFGTAMIFDPFDPLLPLINARQT